MYLSLGKTWTWANKIQN